MTYTPLTATTKFSELPEALNGVTTRNQVLVYDTASVVGAAPDDLVGDIHVRAFDTGDVLYFNWPIPDRIDRSVNMTLKLLGAPATSEASKEVSFDIKIVALDSTAGTLINGTTATIQIIDQAVSATAHTVEEFTATIAAATFLGADIDALAIEITRPAASNDLAGNWNMVTASLQFTIER